MKLTVSDFIGKLTMIVILIAMVIAIAHHPRTAEAADGDFGVLTVTNTIITHTDSIKGTEFGVFDIKRYPAVKFARTVIKNKGTYGAVLNAANEVAVNAFLDHKIRFTMIEKIISLMMKMHQNISHPTYEDIVKVDRQTRETVNYLIKEGGIK